MTNLIKAELPNKVEAQTNGVVYAKIPPKPQTSPEQLRVEMEQQMEAKENLLRQVKFQIQNSKQVFLFFKKFKLKSIKKKIDK